MGRRLRMTIRAASGSIQKLYSAAGVMLPPPQGSPPMTTQRPTCLTISGLRVRAFAMLVRGPRATTVNPGLLSIVSMIFSTAGPFCAVRRSGLKP